MIVALYNNYKFSTFNFCFFSLDLARVGAGISSVISTGQAAVFYNYKESSHILGGGWITEAPNKSADIKFYNA